MITEFHEAECKMGKPYNGFPGVTELLTDLDRYVREYQFVDTDREYWKNDADKVIIMINLEGKTAQEKACDIAGIAKVAVDNRADEVNYELVEGEYLIIKLWWD